LKGAIRPEFFSMIDLPRSPVPNLTVQDTERQPEKSFPSHTRYAIDFLWKETGLPSFPKRDG